MTRVQTPTTDTVTLNGADLANAIDQFVRRCHQDLATTQPYTLVTPAGPVAHFDVRCAVSDVSGAEIFAGETLGGVVVALGDRVLIVDNAAEAAGIWVVGASEGTRATDCDVVAELTATPYVRVTAGTDAGRWYLLDDDTIVDIALATYNLLAE